MTVHHFPPRHSSDGTRWEPWVTESALAGHFCVSTRTVRRWRSQGIPCLKMAAGHRYKISDATDWLRETKPSEARDAHVPPPDRAEPTEVRDTCPTCGRPWDPATAEDESPDSSIDPPDLVA